MGSINRYSSRRARLDKRFLANRLASALSYDRITGYFSSSLFEVVGEELESMVGKIRMVCNSNLHPQDVKTAKAAKIAIWKSWAGAKPEALIDETIQYDEAAQHVRDFNVYINS